MGVVFGLVYSMDARFLNKYATIQASKVLRLS